MEDAVWSRGLVRLLVSLPDPRGRKFSTQERGLRGEIYRDHLDRLSPECWEWVVERAIGRSEFFPTVRALLELAGEWEGIQKKKAADARYVLEHEARRKQLEEHVAAVEASPRVDTGAVTFVSELVPGKVTRTLWTEEQWKTRREELLKQAEAIGAVADLVDGRAE